MTLVGRDAFFIERLTRFNPRIAGAVAATAIVILALYFALNAGGRFDSSRGEMVVVSLRIIVPLLILRFWFTGGIVAMLLDAGDVVITDALNIGGFGDHYAELDKVLDSYYLALELIVAFGWRNSWARIPAVLLFFYRVVGVALFEVTGARIFLFLFPNMFENWWLYVVIVMKWFEALVPHNWRTVWVPMVILLVPKMIQEYILHFAEVKPYRWIKDNILGPIGVDY
ncbi:MAG TPA: hypothetical protein PJ994_10855 [Tepidiformaceae bacterium]|nr:hypothetical protein [Tepidiformaceae bacterium]HMO94741.1 hypothetical protein [Tepidiformaceae bacterium]